MTCLSEKIIPHENQRRRENLLISGQIDQGSGDTWRNHIFTCWATTPIHKLASKQSDSRDISQNLFQYGLGSAWLGKAPLFFTQLVRKFGELRSPDDKLSLFLDSLSMSQPLSRFLLSVFFILLGVHSVSAVKAQSALMMKFMNTGMTHNGMSSAEFNSALVALQEQA